MADRLSNVTIWNATLVFKNFAGREGKYNREGDRSCSVLLDDKLAADMKADGWNVKELKAREEGDTPQQYLPFSVRYPRPGDRVHPPTVVFITSKGRNIIPEEMCELIDQADIAKVDLIIRPYEWAVNGNTGVKAYLKSLYITMAEDELALHYQDIPEVGAADAPLAITSGADENDGFIEGEAWFEDEPEPKAIGR